MAAEPSMKARAWVLFDRIVADAAPGGVHTNPWVREEAGALRYAPDFATLTRLLGVPLLLGAATQTGVPALSLDVWLSYELRRAGFDPDAAWPRATHPRILPMPIARLLQQLPKRDRPALEQRLTAKTPVAGVTSASASILGKNYLKQVDVIMTDWATGPELLISTKRMDSSFGKNAANRVEESYGDAKNLRLRHPLAALGFVYGLRSDILDTEPDTAAWLIDLLQKLGREDDAYHATCLVMLDYDDPVAAPAGGGEDPEQAAVVDGMTARLPPVALRHDAIPDDLAPARFLAAMVDRVLDATPVNFHTEARRRKKAAAAP